jgi:glycosyltransferase 2 family protein
VYRHGSRSKFPLSSTETMNVVSKLLTVSRRNPAIRILGSAILLGLLAIVLPRDKLAEALRSVSPLVLLAAIPIFLAIQFLSCVKWHLIVNLADARLPLIQSVRCYFGGLFSNLLFPGLIGGDIVTITLAVSRGAKKESIVSGTLVSRVLDLTALLLLTCLAVFALPHRLDAVGERLVELVLGAFLVAGVLAVVGVILLRRKLQGKVAAYWLAFASGFQRPAVTFLIFGISLLSQAGLVMLMQWVGSQCGLDLPLRAWLFAWPLAKLSAFVPITLAGIGTREFVLAALLVPFGAEPAAAAVAGLAWGAVYVIGSLVSGVISKSASLLVPPSEPCPT